MIKSSASTHNDNNKTLPRKLDWSQLPDEMEYWHESELPSKHVTRGEGWPVSVYVSLRVVYHEGIPIRASGKREEMGGGGGADGNQLTISLWFG